jgi:hypothetical protein
MMELPRDYAHHPPTMRMLSSYNLPAIAANLTAHTVRRSRNFCVHYGVHVMRHGASVAASRVRALLQLAGVALYCVFSFMMLLSGCLAAVFEAMGRAFLPRRFEHLDQRLSTILDDVLREPAE